LDYLLGKVHHRSQNATIVASAGVYPVINSTVFLGCGARIIGNVCLKQNCSVWFNAVIRGDVNSIEIEEGTNIQDGAVIHGTYKKHGTWIGSHVSLGHQATLHGCHIEEGSLIGMQAVILDGACIGARSLIGAGTVVTSHTLIPPESLVLGSPGKVVRQLTQDEMDSMFETTKRYYELYINSYNFKI